MSILFDELVRQESFYSRTRHISIVQRMFLISVLGPVMSPVFEGARPVGSLMCPGTYVSIAPVWTMHTHGAYGDILGVRVTWGTSAMNVPAPAYAHEAPQTSWATPLP